MTKKNTKIVLWSGFIISTILSFIFFMGVANEKCEECSVGLAIILISPPLIICSVLIIISILDIIETHSTNINPNTSKKASIIAFIIIGIIISWLLIDNYLKGFVVFIPMFILSIIVIIFSFSKRLRNNPPHS